MFTNLLTALWGRIPQSEIDAEAYELVEQYGDRAMGIAYGAVIRSQWVKGSNDAVQRAARVSRAVHRLCNVAM